MHLNQKSDVKNSLMNIFYFFIYKDEFYQWKYYNQSSLRRFELLQWENTQKKLLKTWKLRHFLGCQARVFSGNSKIKILSNYCWSFSSTSSENISICVLWRHNLDNSRLKKTPQDRRGNTKVIVLIVGRQDNAGGGLSPLVSFMLQDLLINTSHGGWLWPAFGCLVFLCFGIQMWGKICYVFYSGAPALLKRRKVSCA